MAAHQTPCAYLGSPSAFVRCSIPVIQGQVLKLQVTGVADTDSGAFTLRILSLLPGASVAVAKDLGSDAMVSASGDSTGFADSLPSSSCGAAGSDVVSLGGGRARILCTAAAAAAAAVVPSKQAEACTHMSTRAFFLKSPCTWPSPYPPHPSPAPSATFCLLLLQYYSYTANATGLLSAKACSNSFTASVTVMVTAAKAGGPMVTLACGFCADPPM